jgi:SAM-dependent methyltransferase
VAASERLAWTADLVAPSPSDRVLEVGCGHGVLVSLLAERLTDGVVIGVDRSAAMIAAAGRRNRVAIRGGRVRLVTAAVTDADLGVRAVDVVVSFDVRAFWTPPGHAWEVVDRVLTRAGRVVVAFSVMGTGSDGPVTAAIERLAGERGFACAAVHRGRTRPMESVAVELRRG